MGLDELIRGLEGLAKSGFADAQNEAEKAVQGVLQAQYQAGVGPDGETWADKVDGTASYLKKSGDMQRGTSAVRGVGGIDVKVPSPGGFHQSGTGKMPARKVVPDDGNNLPPSWEQPVSAAVEGVLKRAIGP